MSYQTFEQIGASMLPKSLKTKFGLNEAHFQNFKDSLRRHQVDAIEALRGFDTAQVSIPTGTGKSYIQNFIHVEDMIEKTKNNETGVYVIAAHRLALCTQLFNGVLDLLISCGLKADMLYVGSERYNFDSVNKKYQHLGFSVENVEGGNTTSSGIIATKAENAKKNNRHLIVVSTYHSFHRMCDIETSIDVATFDEAHTTTSEFFTENISQVKDKIKRKYFFTATRRVAGEDGGQNDESFYGPVVFEMSPKEAIERGEIVRPRLHFIRSNASDVEVEGNEHMTVKTVIEAFEKHRSKVYQFSSNPKSIGPKMLIAVNGLHELHRIHNNEGFRTYCRQNMVKTFAFSSDDGEYYNFNSISRQNALDKMAEMDDSENAIMLHYDILTEGIDLPSITGVLLLRDLPTTKLLQNVGRGARLLKVDRESLYLGKIISTDVEKMVKPFCWVILPEYLKTLSGGSRIREMIVSLRETYNIEVELIGEDDDALSKTEVHLPRVTKKDSASKKKKDDQLFHIYEEILIEELKGVIYGSANPKQKLSSLVNGVSQ